MHETALLKLELVESLLVSIASSLNSSSGVPSRECLFNSLYAAQLLLGDARSVLEN